jgi:ubiquinone/menaquinone biosynthesis C-methylase UbiE
MYNPQGGDFERFPVPDGGFTAILAQSFFSHIAPPLSVLYLAECRRVLDKGGLFYSTWFRTQDKGRISGAAGRTVYLESDIRAMLSGAGFDIVDLWGPDESEGYHAQSEVVCRPRERVRA